MGVGGLGDEQLPVPLHGDRRVDGPDSQQEVGGQGAAQSNCTIEDFSSTGRDDQPEAGSCMPTMGLPGLSHSRREGISYTKVSRGDMI